MWLLSPPVLRVIFLLTPNFGQWDYNVSQDRFLNVSGGAWTCHFHHIGGNLWHVCIQNFLCLYLCPPSFMQIPNMYLLHTHQAIWSGPVFLWCFFFNAFILLTFGSSFEVAFIAPSLSSRTFSGAAVQSIQGIFHPWQHSFHTQNLEIALFYISPAFTH